MTGSPVSEAPIRGVAGTRGAVAAGMLAIVLAAVHPASATEDVPLRLMPAKPDPRQEAPARAPPGTAAPEVGEPTTVDASTSARRPGSTAIEVDPLHTINAETVGILSRDEGGFGIGLWSGTPRSLIEALLPRLPVRSESRAMRDLMRRLLLSRAAVPDRPSEGGSLIATRVGLLVEMGDLAGVNGLLKAIPERSAGDELAYLEADTRFLTNDNARACTLATNLIAEHADDVYWQEAFIFCQALAGQHEKALLGVALLREVGEGDPVFFSLVEALGGDGTAVLDSLSDPSPLHLAMARAAQAELPADAIQSGRLEVLRNVAMNPNAPLELRLEAAERAVAAGALPVDALRQLYTAIPFSEDDLSNPFSMAEVEGGSLARALLYRAAVVEIVPAALAESVAKAFALGQEEGRYPTTVRAFMPALRRIPPSTELIWFAPTAIRAFVLEGAREALGAWTKLLQAGALIDPEARAALSAVLPIVRLSGAAAAAAWVSKDLIHWWDRVRETERARERATLLFTLLAAFDEPVPPAVLASLLECPERETTTMLHGAHWLRMRRAARAGRVGETVLLALLAFGEEGPAAAAPPLLGEVLANLVTVGLEEDARALAVEAALVAGL